MRRVGVPLFSYVFLVLVAFTQPFAFGQNADQDKAAINKLLQDQEAAWNKGDIEDFMRGYQDSPDTTFIGKTVQHGYRPILERYRTAYATPDAMGKLTFSELDIRMLGPDHAVVVGKFHLTRNAAGGGDSSGNYSLILEREREGWRIILDHTSTN